MGSSYQEKRNRGGLIVFAGPDDDLRVKATPTPVAEDVHIPDHGILLGTGMLSWSSRERVSDRYGSVCLSASSDPDVAAGKVEGTWVEFLTLPHIFAEYGRAWPSGALIARVIETRESDHLGDIARGIRPSTPPVGSRISLGEGRLFCEPDAFFTQCVGVYPTPRRQRDWLNPHALYRLHSQTVELYFVPDHPAVAKGEPPRPRRPNRSAR